MPYDESPLQAGVRALIMYGEELSSWPIADDLFLVRRYTQEGGSAVVMGLGLMVRPTRLLLCEVTDVDSYGDDSVDICDALRHALLHELRQRVDAVKALGMHAQLGKLVED